MAAVIDGGHRAIFFDLDGTLVDTALDMVRVLQGMQQHHDRLPVAYELGRSHVSNGAVGLLRLGFPGVEGDELEALRIEYLERYGAEVCTRSRLFTGLGGLLDRLDAGGVPWGVVTNKPGRLTDALLAALNLAERCACAVAGDTLPVRKPDPAPLRHACDLVGIEPARAVYIGDAARDIEAGRAAGMATVAAAYGYIVAGDDPATWGADEIAADTLELAQIVAKAVNLVA